MKTLLLLPLFLGSIAAFTQSEMHFLNCDESNQNCEINLAEVKDLGLKHYQQARIFFFTDIMKGKTQELAVVADHINFQVPEETKIMLVKLQKGDDIDHLWLHLPNKDNIDEDASRLIRAQLYAGAHSQITGLATDYNKANAYFEALKENNETGVQAIYTEYYWNAFSHKSKEAALAAMVSRSKISKNPDELVLLIKKMGDLGDTLYSQQLSDRLLKEFPEHPISIEMNTWDLRKQSYLTKEGAANYKLYKQYLKQTAPYRSTKAQERVENHRAQFLVNLYQHYWDMDYNWLKEVYELSPTNQAYVFSITARGLMDTSPLESYDLVDRALEISTESLIKDLSKKENIELLTQAEKEHQALKCKDLAYYLKGQLWLKEKEEELALQSFQKAVELNEYVVEDYNIAYANALKKAEKWDELALFLGRVSADFPLSPSLQKFATLQTQKNYENPSKETPHLTFTDEKGQIVELGQSSLELLDIWNSDCENCMKSFPDLYFLQRTFAKNLNVFSIPTDDVKLGHATLQSRGFDVFQTMSPNLLESLKKQYDFKEDQAKILLDTNGKVLYKKVGSFNSKDLSELQSVIENFLKNTPSK